MLAEQASSRAKELAETTAKEAGATFSTLTAAAPSTGASAVSHYSQGQLIGRGGVSGCYWCYWCHLPTPAYFVHFAWC